MIVRFGGNESLNIWHLESERGEEGRGREDEKELFPRLETDSQFSKIEKSISFLWDIRSS